MKYDVMAALKYFHEAGMIENTYGDQRYYLEILMKFAADKMRVSLE